MGKTLFVSSLWIRTNEKLQQNLSGDQVRGLWLVVGR